MVAAVSDRPGVGIAQGIAPHRPAGYVRIVPVDLLTNLFCLLRRPEQPVTGSTSFLTGKSSSTPYHASQRTRSTASHKAAAVYSFSSSVISGCKAIQNKRALSSSESGNS